MKCIQIHRFSAADEFRQWKLRLYSPLCLAFGTAALAARAYLPA